MKLSHLLRAALASACSLLISSFVQGAVTGPYSVDANTLHLWHFEDSTMPILDSPMVTTPVNMQSLGSWGNVSQLAQTSYSGFGSGFQSKALRDSGVFAKTPASGSADDTSLASFRNSATGAFTYEIMLRIDDFTVTDFQSREYQIISAENDLGGSPLNSTRGFQFRLDNLGTANQFELSFYNVYPNEFFTSSSVTVTPGTWYHAAVTYNGAQNTNDNLKLYWTEVAPSSTSANLVGLFKMLNDLTVASSDFAIGSEGRDFNNSIGQWNGMIDEVRISDIARGADQFIFTVPEPSLYIVAVGCAILIGIRKRIFSRGV